MAPAKKTKKKTDGTRTSVHGRTKYYSYPADNQACPMRCSPPTRRTEQDGTRKTTVKYRHRTLDITSSGRSPSKGRTATKKAVAKPKTTKAATKKATPKKTVAKAPAKPKAPAKVKAPAKAKAKAPTKADAEKIITRLTKNAGFKNVSFRWEQSRKISDLGWVRGTGKEAGDFKWLLSTKLAGLTPMAIQDITDKVLKRIKSGKNEQFRPATVMDLRKHGLKLPNYDQNGHLIGDVGSIREKTVKETVKIPGTKNAAIKKAILDKSSQDGMNAKELSKHLVVASVPKQTAKKEPAKAPASSPGKTMLPPSMYGPNMSPGYVGKFDGASLKRLAKAINVLYGTSLAVPLPLFDVPATFANQSRTMLLSVWGFNGKATSLVGGPPANKHFAVDMARVVNQIGNGECDFGIGGELGPNKVRFLTQGSKIDVPVSDKYSDSKTLVENLDNYLTQGYDVNEYKTTAQRFVQDLKKVVTVQRGKQQNVDKDSAINVCPNGKLSKADNGADRQCGQFSNYLLYRAVKILQLANKQECIVTTRPGYPIRIHFHIGKYVADLYIAPMQIQ